MLKTALFCLILSAPVWAQNRVDGVRRVAPDAMYYRVYARVPFIGGTAGSPRRPMFAPLLSEMKGDHTGVLAYQMVISDDGMSALVEFVGATRNDLASIINSTASNVQVFEPSKTTQAAIEAEF